MTETTTEKRVSSMRTLSFSTNAYFFRLLAILAEENDTTISEVINKAIEEKAYREIPDRFGKPHLKGRD
ncbi:hypothetical protein WDZ92_34890 [Nostoc sp. NIES-2111]